MENTNNENYTFIAVIKIMVNNYGQPIFRDKKTSEFNVKTTLDIMTRK